MPSCWCCEFQALLDWCNTPSEDMDTSPAQRFFGRCCKKLLLTTEDLLKPRFSLIPILGSCALGRRSRGNSKIEPSALCLHPRNARLFVFDPRKEPRNKGYICIFERSSSQVPWCPNQQRHSLMKSSRHMWPTPFENYDPPSSQPMKKVDESTALNSLPDLAMQIPEPLVPHPCATPEALPLVTDSMPAPDPSGNSWPLC